MEAWEGSLTPEQGKAIEAFQEKVEANEKEMKQAQEQETIANFKAADADGDGVLNLAEFLVYCQKEKESSEAKGFPMAHALLTDEQRVQEYNAFNKIKPGKEGLTVTDIRMGRGLVAQLAFTL